MVLLARRGKRQKSLSASLTLCAVVPVLKKKGGEEREPFSPKRAASETYWPIGVVSAAPMDGTLPSEVW